MDFLISDTFTASLGRLTTEEQKSVKTSAFDLQLNPASPSFQFHRLDKAKDKNFWSIRVNRDLRIIVHKTASSVLLCYVDHHNKAYDWAERRKLERHPTTGAAQLVEIRETVKEISVARIVEKPLSKAKKRVLLFRNASDSDLLSYGVPPEWLADVREADEESFLTLSQHLPAEATEALLNLATGSRPVVQKPAEPDSDPFQHPDSQRRFRLVTSVSELQRALDYPWEKWTVFLHPAQRSLVERSYNGPVRVSGSAGTGKTIVALHRAVYLARRQDKAKVLLATFSDTLAASLRRKIDLLTMGEPSVGERIEVASILETAKGVIAKSRGDACKLADEEVIREWILEASNATEGHRFTIPFLWNEWKEIIDAWQIRSWEEYRDVSRLGRKTRLAEKQRAVIWEIYSQVIQTMEKKKLFTSAGLFAEASLRLSTMQKMPFDFAIVDEAQDTGVPEMKFLAALASGRSESLFFCGDLGQRIFQTPFSWKSVGIDIRGRSHTLRINYRTSQQIRKSADLLLPTEVSDVDGNSESRSGTISVFEGPPPSVRVCEDKDTEIIEVSNWIRDRIAQGFLPDEMGIFVRSEKQIMRAKKAAVAAGLKTTSLGEDFVCKPSTVAISTMHLAKGLEFRAVVVMACDDDVVPLQSRIDTVTDDSDLQEVYETERHLLYVACTRARDQLLITGVKPASEFLDDLLGGK
jgi:superfamily I DNA/RNA helicase